MAKSDALSGLLRWTRRPQLFACLGHAFLTDMINDHTARPRHNLAQGPWHRKLLTSH